MTLNATGIPAIPWRANAPRILLFLALLWFSAIYPNDLGAAPRPPGSVEIAGGSFMPMYGAGKVPAKLPVKPFRIDALPITNEQFLKFVSGVPGWDKKNASSLLVDEKYLGHWQETEQGFRPDNSYLKSPVTNVSWFGANEYCKWQNGRLPSVLEWEYVAAASEAKKDASNDPKFVAKLLQWYAQPNNAGQPGPIGQHKPNIWGIYDLHGLIWEWTSDFNGVFVSGDNRREGEDLKNAFCGNSAVSATDRANYAAFMRYAMRNSLKPRYSTNSIGFRCAYDR